MAFDKTVSLEGILMKFVTLLGRPGNDLLSRVLRRSTIGSGAFHGRVRNGIGCSHPDKITRSAKERDNENWSFFLVPVHSHTGGVAAREATRRVRPSKMAESDRWHARRAPNNEHCLMRAIKSIELLVPVSYTLCSASTPGLSTR